jgi:hypothetical protein
MHKILVIIITTQKRLYQVHLDKVKGTGPRDIFQIFKKWTKLDLKKGRTRYLNLLGAADFMFKKLNFLVVKAKSTLLANVYFCKHNCPIIKIAWLLAGIMYKQHRIGQ